MRRFGPLVFAVCRRVLGNEHDAEDAFQATFLVLARRPGAVRQRASVGSWLYGVAYRVARNARRGKARRNVAESRARESQSPDRTPEQVWHDLQRLFDEEVDRLPEPYRTPFVLAHLGGKTNVEIAGALQCPVGTVESRLTRARDRLVERLSRRGLFLTAGLLATLLPRYAAGTAVPAEFADATRQAALSFAGIKPPVAGAPGARVVALAEGFLRSVFLVKLKVGTVLGLLMVLVTVAVVVLMSRPSHLRGGNGVPRPVPSRAPDGDRRAADLAQLQGSWNVELWGMGDQFVPGRYRMIFSGSKAEFVSLNENAPPKQLIFDLNPTADPKRIDVTLPDGGTALGIYRLAGEQLMICYDLEPGNRPRDFEPKPGSRVIFYILRREPPGIQPKTTIPDK
jgi:RNA polymerase sigma-70 factor (ECF subfamily)